MTGALAFVYSASIIGPSIPPVLPALHAGHPDGGYEPKARSGPIHQPDLEGLVTEAPSLEALTAKVLTMVVELLELSGEKASDLPEIPVQIMAQQIARVPNPAFI